MIVGLAGMALLFLMSCIKGLKMNDLFSFKVNLKKSVEDEFFTVYECKASDAHLAAYMAESAYPGYIVFTVSRTDWS